jgi:hypothetical protein
MPDSALKPLLLRNALDRIRAQGNTPTPPPQDDPRTLRGTAFNALFDVMGGNTDDQAKRSRATRTANMLAGSGRTVADFTPIVGDALAVGDARDAFKQGRYGEGALLGGLAALGMVPLVGDLAKKGADLAMDTRRALPKQMFPEANRVTNLNRTGPTWDAITRENPAMKNSPDMVTVYRATIGNEIRPNDFVAANKEIAESHLQNLVDRGEKAKIISIKVPTSSLLMANDATEFVYFPISQ